jgi:hypothetical protein
MSPLAYPKQEALLPQEHKRQPPSRRKRHIAICCQSCETKPKWLLATASVLSLFGSAAHAYAICMHEKYCKDDKSVSLFVASGWFLQTAAASITTYVAYRLQKEGIAAASKTSTVALSKSRFVDSKSAASPASCDSVRTVDDF